MEMNVTNAVKYETAKANENYEIDKDLVTEIKEKAAEAAKNNTGSPSQDFLNQQAAIFERSEVKSFLGQFHRDTVTGINTLGQTLFYRYEDKQGYGPRNHAFRELYSMSISDRADFYKKAYADMYDEIERGYADGTRKTYVVDNGVKRLATKEEELNALEKEYANKTRRQYNKAFEDAVKAADPTWKPGKKIPAGALDGITRESIEKSLVKTQGQYGETFTRGVDYRL